MNVAPGTQIVALSRGELSVADLWSQHNESRKLFLCLYCLAVVWLLDRWDVKDEMLLMFAFACTASFA